MAEATAEATGDVEVGKVSVKKSQLGKAIKALTQWIEKKSANSNALFGSDTQTMNVLFTLSTIPDKRSAKSVMIPLPHPLYDGTSEICFICKDPQKPVKELLLQKNNIPGLSKVIGVGKVRRNYKTVEEKKALADAFDLFVADRDISDQLPSTLGRIFYKQKLKVPISVKLAAKDPAASIQKAISGTPLRMPAGVCVGVKFGRCSMPEEQLLANAAAVINNTTKHLARLENHVQAIMVQATDSPALPVWRRPRPPGELLDLKKYRSDTGSSAASDTGISGSATSDTEASRVNEATSDTLETLSNRDTLSEVDTGVDTLSELDTTGESISELDSDAGDIEEKPLPKQEQPVVKGLKKGKRRAAEKAEPAAAAPEAPAKDAAMPPPPKKMKKGKAKA